MQNKDSRRDTLRVVLLHFFCFGEQRGKKARSKDGDGGGGAKLKYKFIKVKTLKKNSQDGETTQKGQDRDVMDDELWPRLGSHKPFAFLLCDAAPNQKAFITSTLQAART